MSKIREFSIDLFNIVLQIFTGFLQVRGKKICRVSKMHEISGRKEDGESLIKSYFEISNLNLIVISITITPGKNGPLTHVFDYFDNLRPS